MKRLSLTLLALVIIMAFLSCNRQNMFDENQTRQSIEKANAQYCDVIKKGDISGILEIYTDDAILIPPGGEIVKGRQNVQQVYEGMFKMGLKEIKMNTIEVGGLGDMVFEIGKTRVLIQPEGQAAFSDSSKYMVIWKQQTDGTWKVYADIWNFFEQVPR